MANEGDSLGGPRRFCSNCGQRVQEDDQFCPGCGTAVDGGMAATAPGPAEGQYMGFWIRVGATLIDGILIVVIAVILAVITGGIGLVVIYAISPLYYVLLTGFKGQTLGKMVVGIQVVNAQGEVPGFWRAVLREIVGKFVSSVAIYLGYLWIGWDVNKRGWHDHISGTYVVRAIGRGA